MLKSAAYSFQVAVLKEKHRATNNAEVISCENKFPVHWWKKVRISPKGFELGNTTLYTVRQYKPV